MEERWPTPPKYSGHPDGPWWCGGCGGLHGWFCPYERDSNSDRKDRDKAAGVGPFAYGPYPGNQLKVSHV